MLLICSSSSLRLRFALILALVLVLGIAVPAAAQSELEGEQDAESGETDQAADILNEGDNANQCVAVQPVSNTGNAITDLDIVLQFPTGQESKRFKSQDFLDLIDELDLDLEDIGSTIELDPEQAVECAQAVDQAATASEYSEEYSDYWEEYWSGYYEDYWYDYYYGDYYYGDDYYYGY